MQSVAKGCAKKMRGKEKGVLHQLGKYKLVAMNPSRSPGLAPLEGEPTADEVAVEDESRAVDGESWNQSLSTNPNNTYFFQDEGKDECHFTSSRPCRHP